MQLHDQDHRGIAARNYYQDLGCSFLADDEEVRKAYRRIALKLHPDRRPAGADAAERFLRAVEAYEVLSDPEQRRVYDNACQYWLSVEEYLGAFSELLLTLSGLGLRVGGDGSGSSSGGGGGAAPGSGPAAICGLGRAVTMPRVAPPGSLLTAA